MFCDYYIEFFNILFLDLCFESEVGWDYEVCVCYLLFVFLGGFRLFFGFIRLRSRVLYSVVCIFSVSVILLEGV